MDKDLRKITRTVCPYCGTGCGVELEVDGGKVVYLSGDKASAANNGELCSKGISLMATIGGAERLICPQMRGTTDEPFKRASWDEAIGQAAGRFASIIKEHGPESVAFYVSGQLLTEDYYVFNKLMKGFIGSNNIDTNSRLCMSSAVVAYKRAFGADGPPTCYDDIDAAENLFIFGANPAYAHPVLFKRMERAKERGARVVVVDPRRTATASIADLHIPLRPGTDVALLQSMLNILLWEGVIDKAFIEAHTNGFEAVSKEAGSMTPKRAAAICGIEPAEIAKAAYIFADGPSLSFWTMGLNQYTTGTDKCNALINLHLATGQTGKPGSGPFSLTGQPNAMGGREVGGLSTMLSAHRELDNPEHREEMERIWGSGKISPKPGYTATDIFRKMDEGAVKAVWIVCTNPAVSLPDLNLVKRALKKAELVIVSDAYNTETASFAHILLPAATWPEKEGVATNSERSISLLEKAVDPPGEALPDWKIGALFARRLGAELESDFDRPFGYSSTEEIFEEHKLTTRGRDCDITGVSYRLLRSTGHAQWPFPAEGRQGKRLYEEGLFATPDRRARFMDVKYRPVAEAPDEDYPLSLTTGRIRDQWHTMTKTGRVPQLMMHTPVPELEISARDAEERGLQSGSLAVVASRRGTLMAEVKVTGSIREGVVFLPMHWGLNLAVNRLTTSQADPYSKEPELKHAAVEVMPFKGWRALLLIPGMHVGAGSAIAAKYPYGAVACLGREHVVTRIDLAGEGRLDGDKIEEIDCLIPLSSDESLTYSDESSGIMRKIWLKGGKLAAVRWTGAEPATEASHLLTMLLKGGDLSAERATLLAPQGGCRKGGCKTVCSCKGVSESAIASAIEKGTSTVDGIKALLAAGTSCGSCVPQIKEMLSARM